MESNFSAENIGDLEQAVRAAFSEQDYKQAVSLCERLVALYEESVGLFYPSTLNALRDFADAYRLCSVPGRAFDLYLKLRRRAREAFGEQHPLCLEALWGQSECLRGDGRESEAFELLWQAWELFAGKGELNQDSLRAFTLIKETASRFSNQTLYRTISDWAVERDLLPLEERIAVQLQLAEKAVKSELFDEAHSRLDSALGFLGGLDKERFADILTRIKAIAVSFDDLEVVEQCGLRLLDFSIENEGNQEITVRHTDLAQFYATCGDFEKAQEYFDRGVELFNSSVANGQRNTSGTSRTLGELAYAFGRIEESRSFLREALQDALKESPESAQTSDILHNLGTLLFAEGELGEAEAYLSHAVSMRKEHYGLQSAETALSLYAYGKLLERVGKDEPALVAAESCYEIRRELWDEDNELVREAAELCELLKGTLERRAEKALKEERQEQAEPGVAAEPVEESLEAGVSPSGVIQLGAPNEISESPEPNQSQKAPARGKIVEPKEASPQRETRVVESDQDLSAQNGNGPAGIISTGRKRKNTASQKDPLRRAILLVQRGEVVAAIEMLESLWRNETSRAEIDSGRRALILENLADALELAGQERQAQGYRAMAQQMGLE